ncbi:lasso peptide isopeptide bond-forming cyclase [Streptacidiphilus sp. NEAU-YB345]|uniref:Lasso peptide isopeptide bond-forming cyclase n=2 Tax=Streptacidiphilus fuscans TaxID=2789292 RepID=A0A931B2A2_9ACTN|nr:lasso peptide isopeptide bond-forming cyclase [Streptacidiphilus fuscans]
MVLPDCPGAQEIIAEHVAAGAQVVPHASGRPWLVGSWTPSAVTLAAAGSTLLAVIGRCPLPVGELEQLAGRIQRLSDAGRVLAPLRGSCHLALSLPGRVRLHGSASGLRRVFRTQVAGVTVAADRADLLAALTDAPLDAQTLALRVACGLQLPYPANAVTMWSGITAVAPENAVEWDGSQVREITWWKAPEPVLDLSEGAEVVREALLAATAGMRPESGRLSTDLSGGMDSTSLAFLTAREVPDLLTFRWGEAESGNDDAQFAEFARKELDRADHLVVPQDELPDMFAAPGAPVPGDLPSPLTRATARIRHSAALLAGHGSVRHLAGHGGDELFCPMPGYLHGLLRRRPLTAVRHVRAHCALRRWPLRPTLGELLRPGTVTGWWTEQAERLTDPRPPRRLPPLGWGLGPMRAPSWVTPDAADLARTALRDTAEHAVPLADDIGAHQTLLVVRSNTVTYRLLSGLYAEHGIELESPYLDDRVLDAVLRVRPYEHAGPWRFKPLLTEAVAGLVPEQVRNRTTKGEFGEDVRRGLRRHLPAVLELLGPDSELASRGLIDPFELRARLTGPQADNAAVQALENLLGCESWLRAAHRPTTGSALSALSAVSSPSAAAQEA